MMDDPFIIKEILADLDNFKTADTLKGTNQYKEILRNDIRDSVKHIGRKLEPAAENHYQVGAEFLRGLGIDVSLIDPPICVIEIYDEGDMRRVTSRYDDEKIDVERIIELVKMHFAK